MVMPQSHLERAALSDMLPRPDRGWPSKTLTHPAPPETNKPPENGCAILVAGRRSLCTGPAVAATNTVLKPVGRHRLGRPCYRARANHG